MIHIKELSIGNYVLHLGAAKKVGEIISFTEIVLFQEKYYGLYSNRVSINEIEPVPITPEILEKNGIKKEYNILYDDFYYNDDVSVTKAVDEWFVRIGATNSLYVKYVHQLQNALTLCGINKSIEL